MSIELCFFHPLKPAQISKRKEDVQLAEDFDIIVGLKSLVA